MAGRLQGKVSVVTGGSSGFGRATATLFAQEGAKVVIADLDKPNGQQVVTEINDQGGEASLVVGDVSDSAVAGEIVQHAVSAFGTLDVLVNNAGIAQTWVGESWNEPDEAWDKLLRVNLRSAFVCSRAAIPVMRRSGAGSIVNVASIGASVCVSGSAYAASKGGMLSYTRTSAVELAPIVRMNCVSPGFMLTPMSSGERQGFTDEQMEGVKVLFGALAPMARPGSAIDIANAILYFASDESAFVTGQELVVDGGHLVRAYGGGNPPESRTRSQA